MADEENHDEQTMEEGFKTEHEVIEAARRKFLYAIDCDQEAEHSKAKMKSWEKEAAAARAEAEALIMKRQSAQMEIPTPATESADDPENCLGTTGGIHPWKRIRETDGIAIEDCPNCDVERTARVVNADGSPVESPAWAYTSAEELDEENQDAAEAQVTTNLETASAAASPEPAAS